MTETKKEPTPLEKLQAEYNQLVSFLGHNIAQQMSLQKEETSLRERLLKVATKAQNIAKSPKPEEEPKDGTNN